jgi:predicted membrane-bound spermidine synthase
MPRPLGVLVVFIAAGAVLVLEILAIRLAAPYVGITLETYSAAVGVALTGIAAGAGLGGAVADRIDPRRTLGPTLVVGGGLVLAVGPAFDWLGPHVTNPGAKWAVILVGVATLPAITVLSMAHPAVVKLLLARLERTGSTVGALSAVGTGGALAGTFLTGFVLLGSYSTKVIGTATGAVVVVVGLAVTMALTRSARGLMLAVVPVPFLGLALASSRPCDYETAYYCARVVNAADPNVRTLVLDDRDHARLDVTDPTRLFFTYEHRFRDVVDAARPGKRPLRALHVGGGGFAFSRYLAATRPGTRSVVLELDPEIVTVGRERLGLRTDASLRVRVGDARVSIRDEPPGIYDLVVGDAFASRSVPWHLTTREFLVEVRRVMRPGGVYVLNLIDSGGLRFLRSELATLRGTFGHVALLAARSQVTTFPSGNYVVAARRAPLPLSSMRLRARRGGYAIFADDWVSRFAGDAPILTDDYAPVDQLLSTRAR